MRRWRAQASPLTAGKLALRDYRAQVIRELFVPVWQWSSGMSPALWWPGLEKIWLAFEDLNCVELIES